MISGRKVDRENDKNYDQKGVFNMQGIEELEYGEG